ncbi:MBL fold metallo-hydrolase [Sphaerisporangium sp. NPDC005289]|uniref:MBL fold metallo-hydrolase n=1 Tax=Sphaerisporangium sp. NPDC005289 TaxID=3155247 RepID=UPI0033B803B0
MPIIQLRPELHMLVLPFGQAYLWRDAGSVTLVDTGIAGSGSHIAEALGTLGLRESDIDRVVLTHGHNDHYGAAAEVRAWNGAIVMAHRDDAPIVRGEVPRPSPDLTGWERDLWERLGVDDLPAAPPCPVDRELVDGDVLDFGGGARVIAIPGHTDGSIALHLPGPGVLFTGDTVANVGTVMPGVFNTDRERAMESFRALAGLEATLACVGHGDPITGDVGAALRAAASAAPA